MRLDRVILVFLSLLFLFSLVVNIATWPFMNHATYFNLHPVRFVLITWPLLFLLIFLSARSKFEKRSSILDKNRSLKKRIEKAFMVIFIYGMLSVGYSFISGIVHGVPSSNDGEKYIVKKTEWGKPGNCVFLQVTQAEFGDYGAHPVGFFSGAVIAFTSLAIWFFFLEGKKQKN